MLNKNPGTLKTSLIAPCGMNCGLCYAYQRDKNNCTGCNSSGLNKPAYCQTCSIKHCTVFTNSKSKYCSSCGGYPCKRLKVLDKRYRNKYGMSMIENLNLISEIGSRAFIQSERKKWTCSKCGNIISVHKKDCLKCGHER